MKVDDDDDDGCYLLIKVDDDDFDGYLVMKVIIVTEVIFCDVSPVAMFEQLEIRKIFIEWRFRA